MFAFALDSEKELEIITLIDDVKNMENRKNIIHGTIRLINVENISTLLPAIENAEKIYDNHGFICLLDDEKSIVNKTFISNIRVVKLKKNNVTLSGQIWCHPPGYQKAWIMKLNEEISEKNIWKNFRKEELQGWLVYALHTTKINRVKENVKIQIDGNDFHNLDGFFCTIGEEINGIGGYFGRNLHALYDCLNGGFGVKSISEVTWKNHHRSKKLLKTKFEMIIDIFKDNHIKVILE
jgi:RNAse (barnase) inhibitor barstar